MNQSSKFSEFQNIARRYSPRYYLKRSDESVHAIYTDGIVRSSVCLGTFAELEPYIGKLQEKFHKKSWVYIPKPIIIRLSDSFMKDMVTHTHILIKEATNKSFGLEIGFQQDVSSFEDYFNRNERLFYIGLKPSNKENHGMGYHFHLINNKGRTTIIVMFNEQYAWSKLLGEYHAEGHNKGNEINVNSLGKKCKQNIYNVCYEKGKKIPLGAYKQKEEDGFIFYP